MADKFSDISASLESALSAVKSAKAAADTAAQKAADAQVVYKGAVQAVQVAKSDYDKHINEAISGFAQLHQ